jgi:hypothetical protein
MEFWPEIESEEDRWTAFREAIRWRVRTAGSVTKALGASNLSDACKSVNELFLPLAERFPEWEEIESLRQFLLQQVVGEFALRTVRRAFRRRHGLRPGEVRRRRR